MGTWHVVHNAEGLVLGVYGSALLDFSLESAKRIAREVGLPVYHGSLLFKDGVRPHVGQSVSLNGEVKTIYPQEIK